MSRKWALLVALDTDTDSLTDSVTDSAKANAISMQIFGFGNQSRKRRAKQRFSKGDKDNYVAQMLLFLFSLSNMRAGLHLVRHLVCARLTKSSCRISLGRETVSNVETAFTAKGIGRARCADCGAD